MSGQSLEKNTGHALSEFLTWWSYELSLLVPQWVKNAFKQKADRLLIFVDKEEYQFRKEDRLQNISSAKDLKELVSGIKKKKQTKTGLCLRKGQYFKRTLELPSEARFKLDDILTIDMERKTPFKHDKVYREYFYKDLPDNRLLVTQLIVKRSLIDSYIEDLSSENIAISFITAIDADEAELLPVNFISSAKDQNRLSLTTVLYGIILLLFGLIAFFTLDRQQQALNQLQSEIKSRQNAARIIQASAERSHKEIAGILALQTYKTKNASVLRVWNEVSRLLPDTAWITDLKIDKDRIQISGYAETAEILIKKLDQSVLFTDVNFASPVSMDNQKKRERFSLKFTLQETRQ